MDPRSDRDILYDQVIETNNNKIHVKAGEYGLWEIYFEKGLMPEELKGKFTTATLAKSKVYNYLEKKNKVVTKTIELVEDKEK